MMHVLSLKNKIKKSSKVKKKKHQKSEENELKQKEVEV